MKRYELHKTGAAGMVYIEESDILQVRPLAGSDLYAVELVLRNRDAYTIEEGFRYDGRSRTVAVRLSIRQARELVDQDRTAQGKDFCQECYDFGTSTQPDDCARCRVLSAMHKAGHGDGRKIQIPLPAPTSRALPLALFILLALWVWTLNQWSTAAAERDQARQEITLLRRTKGR